MFTVVFGWLASGNSSTLRPFVSVYSVMPSTDGPCLTPSGSAAAAMPAATKNAMGASVRTNQGRKRIMRGPEKRNGEAESLTTIGYRNLKGTTARLGTPEDRSKVPRAQKHVPAATLTFT